MTDASTLEPCAATGKVAYRSPEIAERACRDIRRRRGDRLHAYRCQHCRKWHVGHSDSDKKST